MTDPYTKPNKLTYGKTVLINGSATSAEVDLEGGTLVGVFCPASISSTSFTFTCATAAGGTFVTLQSPGGTDYTVTIASSKYIALPATVFAGVRFMKLVGSASETAKTFTLAVRPV